VSGRALGIIFLCRLFVYACVCLIKLALSSGGQVHLPSAEAVSVRPDVTEGHSNWLWSQSQRWSRKFTSHL